MCCRTDVGQQAGQHSRAVGDALANEVQLGRDFVLGPATGGIRRQPGGYTGSDGDVVRRYAVGHQGVGNSCAATGHMGAEGHGGWLVPWAGRVCAQALD